jgi:hypothetical protein
MNTETIDTLQFCWCHYGVHCIVQIVIALLIGLYQVKPYAFAIT